MSDSAISTWKRLFFSKTMSEKNKSHKIAYIAIMAAFCIVSNIYEIPLSDTQFSLTLAVSALTGLIIGPLFGFVSCFLGDLVGFFYKPGGYAYMPFVGISLGLTAFLFGLTFNGISIKNKWGWVIKIIIASLASFLLCTVLINTTALWFIYFPTTPYLTFLVSRLFISGQIWSSLFNYGLLFVILPAVNKVKALKIDIS